MSLQGLRGSGDFYRTPWSDRVGRHESRWIVEGAMRKIYQRLFLMRTSQRQETISSDPGQYWFRGHVT